MNQTMSSMATQCMPNQIVASAGIAEGITPGLRSVWLGAVDTSNSETSIAQAAAQYPLSNVELLAAAKLEKFKPPQSWYDDDHEGLY